MVHIGCLGSSPELQELLKHKLGLLPFVLLLLLWLMLMLLMLLLRRRRRRLVLV